jgi:DNA-binding CsgD family transcriptional regulator
MQKMMENKSVLTEKELSVLHYLVKGNTRQKTALDLGVSERIIYRRLANIRRKTNTSSNEQMIYEVVKQGLI